MSAVSGVFELRFERAEGRGGKFKRFIIQSLKCPNVVFACPRDLNKFFACPLRKFLLVIVVFACLCHLNNFFACPLGMLLLVEGLYVSEGYMAR